MNARPRPALVAVAACEAFPELHDDWPLLRAALDELGIEGRPAVWSDPSVDWSAFDLVVANGVWDNIHRVDEFLGWVDRVAAIGVPMVNSPKTLRWNIDKRYLRQLQARDVPVVPTRWVEERAGRRFEPGSLELPQGEIVIKPSISGGGHRTARYQPHEHDDARAHAAELVRAGRTVMVQPYVSSIDAVGETGLVYLGGTFSHAMHKDPMIRRGAGPLDNLIENQVVTAATATAAQRELGRLAVVAAEELLGHATAYARVDMVDLEPGTPALLELELLDPVLFFTTRPEAAGTFARVLAARIAAPSRDRPSDHHPAEPKTS